MADHTSRASGQTNVGVDAAVGIVVQTMPAKGGDGYPLVTVKAGEDWSLWLGSEGLFHESRNGREDQIDPDNQRIRRAHHAQTQQRHPNTMLPAIE